MLLDEEAPSKDSDSLEERQERKSLGQLTDNSIDQQILLETSK